MPDPNSSTDVTSTDMSDVIPWPKRNDPSQRFGLLFRRKKNASLVPEHGGSKKGTAESAIEHVGNFLRSDESLLVRKARANRYSKKFREGVVNRILSGALTISQARKELNVSERDLLDWINDRIMRQDQKITKLTQVVEAVQQFAIEGQVERADPVILKDDLEPSAGISIEANLHRSKVRGTTIDGRVN